MKFVIAIVFFVSAVFIECNAAPSSIDTLTGRILTPNESENQPDGVASDPKDLPKTSEPVLNKTENPKKSNDDKKVIRDNKSEHDKKSENEKKSCQTKKSEHDKKSKHGEKSKQGGASAQYGNAEKSENSGNSDSRKGPYYWNALIVGLGLPKLLP